MRYPNRLTVTHAWGVVKSFKRECAPSFLLNKLLYKQNNCLNKTFHCPINNSKTSVSTVSYCINSHTHTHTHTHTRTGLHYTARAARQVNYARRDKARPLHHWRFKSHYVNRRAGSGASENFRPKSHNPSVSLSARARARSLSRGTKIYAAGKSNKRLHN